MRARVDFAPDQWELIERAARLEGMSGAEYVRSVALARASGDLSACTAQGASVARDTAEGRVEAVLGNIGYVKRLWEAFAEGGVAAMGDLVDEDVIWRPSDAQGRALRGTQELADFHASAKREMPAIRMFRGNGDDVIVEAEYPRESRTVWLLYHFEGQRLIEAVAFPDEKQAWAYRPASPPT